MPNIKTQKRAHHENVNLLGVHRPVLAHAAPTHAQSADAVRLVQVQVGLVLLLERDDRGQVEDGALHAVHALHQDQDLLPGAPRPRLALHDGRAQLRLQVARPVVLEDLCNS